MNRRNKLKKFFNITVMAGITFLFTVLVFSAVPSPASAGKYFSRLPAREMLEGNYSIHFEKFSKRVTCFKKEKVPAYVRSGKGPLCWSADMRKVKAMHVTVSVVKESLSDETLQDNVFGTIFKVSPETLSSKLLSEQVLPSGMKVSHYRVSGKNTDYKPYISVLKFLVDGNKVLVAFFNGAKKYTGGGVPIQNDVMKFISEGKIYPIR